MFASILTTETRSARRRQSASSKASSSMPASRSALRTELRLKDSWNATIRIRADPSRLRIRWLPRERDTCHPNRAIARRNFLPSISPGNTSRSHLDGDEFRVDDRLRVDACFVQVQRNGLARELERSTLVRGVDYDRQTRNCRSIVPGLGVELKNDLVLHTQGYTPTLVKLPASVMRRRARKQGLFSRFIGVLAYSRHLSASQDRGRSPEGEGGRTLPGPSPYGPMVRYRLTPRGTW